MTVRVESYFEKSQLEQVDKLSTLLTCKKTCEHFFEHFNLAFSRVGGKLENSQTMLLN